MAQSRESLIDIGPALVELGHEFARRGMEAQRLRLRDYYRAWRANVRRPATPDGWGDLDVVGWLGILQIAPFAGVFPERSSGVPCPSCGAEPAMAYVVTAFPGGALSQCRPCGRRFLLKDLQP